jgi:16S rRNA (adenine1518-N6/adenine1519-N6)-dimethyltransferase
MNDALKRTLRRVGVKPSKELGQNFLIDANVIDQIMQFGRPSASDTVVEIGPGLGALTDELIEATEDFSVIEIEPAFCRYLRERHENLTIHEQDVRFFDFSTLGDDLVVFGNLPYSFSSPIIFHLISHAASIQRAILLLQKEFVQRVAASPGGRIYGALSVACQLYADVRTGPIVYPGSFHPPPTVDSQLLELRFLKEPRVPGVDPFWFQRSVQACFYRRRRKLLNSVKASKMFADIDIEDALREAGVDPEARAETLSLEVYGKISECFRKRVNQ